MLKDNLGEIFSSAECSVNLDRSSFISNISQGLNSSRHFLKNTDDILDIKLNNNYKFFSNQSLESDRQHEIKDLIKSNYQSKKELEPYHGQKSSMASRKSKNLKSTTHRTTASRSSKSRNRGEGIFSKLKQLNLDLLKDSKFLKKKNEVTKVKASKNSSKHSKKKGKHLKYSSSRLNKADRNFNKKWS